MSVIRPRPGSAAHRRWFARSAPPEPTPRELRASALRASEAREEMSEFDTFPPGVRHLAAHYPRPLDPAYITLAIDLMGAGSPPDAIIAHADRLQRFAS